MRRAVQKEYEQEYAELSESTEVTVLSGMGVNGIGHLWLSLLGVIEKLHGIPVGADSYGRALAALDDCCSDGFLQVGGEGDFSCFQVVDKQAEVPGKSGVHHRHNPESRRRRRSYPEQEAAAKDRPLFSRRKGKGIHAVLMPQIPLPKGYAHIFSLGDGTAVPDRR